MLDYVDNTYATLWISRGILFLAYKPGIFIDLEAAKSITTDRLILQGYRPYPVFVDFRKAKGADKAARDYFAAEGAMLMLGVSVLIHSETARVIVDIYQKASRPTVPVKVFTDKDKALDYLEGLSRTV